MNIKDDDKNMNVNPNIGNNVPIGRYQPMFIPPNMNEIPIMRQPYQNPNFGGSYYPTGNVSTDTG